ncbi:MAG: ribosomal RNA small subunit methyltransferase A [Nitrospirae bacterium]|nr:ribosomal RNA small subunit methyltransferase A [Nitrospirota bacterium]
MKKNLGQHFLYNRQIVQQIVKTAELEPDDLVIEIGPGLGIMTTMLAEIVKKVIAIELDHTLFNRLQTTFASYKNIELIHGDAMKYPYEFLPYFKVVANIPYYITTPIIFRLLEAKKHLKSMTLTVQKEVAERIIAKPGGKAYGVLTIMVQYHGHSTLKFLIPKKAFRPVPEVDSAVVHIRILEKPPVDVKDNNLFFRIIKTAFSQRRKMLSNSLKSICPDTKEWLKRISIDPERRPETLSIEEFALLANSL